ncbi:MAG: hypothetical protein JXB07_22145 [Anaerolineae bacterium]|nr:hypothetical protein [Anaerolineae bacterium]
MTKKLSLGLLAAISIGTIILLATAGAGIQHVEPASMFRQAEQEWEKGNRWKALRGYARASVITIDAGARWTIAQIYINQMTYNQSIGRVDKALSKCDQAITILSRYDDEGSLSYECFTLETEIKRQRELE